MTLNGCSSLSVASSDPCGHRFGRNQIRTHRYVSLCSKNEALMGMLLRQSHQPICTPEWMRIGGCLVNVPLREIRPQVGPSIRITPKAMGVLLTLVEANGRPVPRDALLASVWPNTLPTGDVVTQAIVQLRKVLIDESDVSYISTINRTGYRLTVSAQWLEEEPRSPKPNFLDGWAPPGVAANSLVQGVPSKTEVAFKQKRPIARLLVGALLATGIAASLLMNIVSQ